MSAVDPDDLETAVEMVCCWLEERGHCQLARELAVVTDPTPPEKTAATVAALRRLCPELVRR